MEENNKIKILITGDFCPHNRVEKLALNSDYKAVFNDFIDVFKDNDLNVTDLECPLTLINKGRKKTGPHQKANPKCIDLLKYINVQLVALANNHIMDYGSRGAQETVELCSDNSILIVGAGKNEADADKPLLITLKNKKFTFINVADNEFLTAADGEFQANPVNPANIYYNIVKAKANSDFIVVIVHAGNEFYPLPSPRTKRLYRLFADFGADVIISNHTHCYSGYEVYKEKIIFYGLGNFIYDWPGRNYTDWNKGYAVRLIFTDKIMFEIIPLKQGNEITGVFHTNEYETNEFFIDLNYKNNIISDDSRLTEAFNQYIKKVSPIYDSFIEPYYGRICNALRQKGILPNLITRKKRMLLLNIIRCESHREVLLNMLSQDK